MNAARIVLALLAAPSQSGAMTTSEPDPIVIAHRGASGLRPEHTIAAYTLAIEQGADFIEPDLVPTKDGVLVARHENEISETTDVAAHPEFAARKGTKTIDGKAVTGWFVEDFTLAELKTLRARERLPLLRSTKYDGQFDVPTFDEILALARTCGVGVYPETKHPTYFASIGLGTDAPLLAALKRVGWDNADAPVFIQSFEVANLKRLSKQTKVRLIQLLDASGAPADGAKPSYAAMVTPAGLKAIAAYANGIGPARAMIYDGDGPATSLVADAHAAGLKVHPWTFRAENLFLPKSYRAGLDPRAHGRVEEEIARYLELGVDGFFTDFPLEGVRARNARRPGARRGS